MNRRGFLAMFGLGVVAAPAVPRRVYSFLWQAPVEPLPPFFGIDRVPAPAWGQNQMVDLMKRLYTAENLEKLWNTPRREQQLIVSPEQYRGIKGWLAENPL